MSRESLESFTVQSEPQPRLALSERLRPLLVLVSASVVAAAVAGWLSGPSAPPQRPTQGDALAKLVTRSRQQAFSVAPGTRSTPQAPATSALGAVPTVAAAAGAGAPPPAHAGLRPERVEPDAAWSKQPTPGKPSAAEGAQPETVAPAPPADAPPDVAELAAGYHIQVASLRVKDTADELAASLRKQGFRARSDPYGLSKSGWWHVVRIGPFRSRIEAESRRLQLDPAQRISGVVLPRSNGKYHVQVASLRNSEPAIALLKRLQQRGHFARITAVGETNQPRWHCVRIGPFDSRQEAEDYRTLLQTRDNIDSQIIPFAPAD